VNQAQQPSSPPTSTEVAMPLMAQALFNRIAAAKITLHKPSYAVNVGCADGKSANDPVYPLFLSGFHGLAIDLIQSQALLNNLGHLPVILRTGTRVTPQNLATLIRDANVPPNPEFLKMDIDGYDAPVLEGALMAGIRPLVIQIEINSEIPPPIAFSVAWHPKYKPAGETGFFGCSLAYASDMLRKYGYVLAQLDFTTQWTHDALFVDRAMLAWNIGLAERDPRLTFLEQKPVIPHLDSATHEQRLAWRKRTDFESLRDEIWVALATANEKKHGHRDIPFELYICKSS
jgi:hypothetical protein